MRLSNPFRNQKNLTVLQKEPLYKYTSLGVGGEARYFCAPRNFIELKTLIEIANENFLSYKIIGNGTNLLISDDGYDGLIISLKKFFGFQFLTKNCVKVYAGESLRRFIIATAKKKLSGMEELAGIPASVGGAIKQNAGAFSKSISDNILSVTCFVDGRLITLKKEQCGFGYRTSKFKSDNSIILSAIFNLKNSDEKQAIKLINKTDIKRRAIQPLGRTCGSVFKNPKSISAGELIDKAGLKGFSVGNAYVSTKHANFIINEGRCAKDIYLLISYVKQEIKRQFGINLTEEVETVGKFQ